MTCFPHVVEISRFEQFVQHLLERLCSTIATLYRALALFKTISDALLSSTLNASLAQCRRVVHFRENSIIGIHSLDKLDSRSLSLS